MNFNCGRTAILISGESGRGIGGGDGVLGGVAIGDTSLGGESAMGDPGLGGGAAIGDTSLGGGVAIGDTSLFGGGGSESGELNELSGVPDSSFSSLAKVSASSPVTEANSLKPLSRTVRFTA